MTRGQIVLLAVKGSSASKPRPALVVQSDLFNETHASISICPITSDCIDAPLFRIAVPPGSRTGLAVPSQVMVDKMVSVPREAIGRVIGACDGAEMAAISGALRGWLDV